MTGQDDGENDGGPRANEAALRRGVASLEPENMRGPWRTTCADRPRRRQSPRPPPRLAGMREDYLWLTETGDHAAALELLEVAFRDDAQIRVHSTFSSAKGMAPMRSASSRRSLQPPAGPTGRCRPDGIRPSSGPDIRSVSIMPTRRAMTSPAWPAGHPEHALGQRDALLEGGTADPGADGLRHGRLLAFAGWPRSGPAAHLGPHAPPHTCRKTRVVVSQGDRIA